VPYSTDRFPSPLNIGQISIASLYRQIYLAAEHRRHFLCLLIQTDLPRRWTSAIFRLPFYTDRFISPLNIGEIFFASLYRHNYLAAEHRRDFLCLIIQTDLPRRWTSARFRLPHYTDRFTSPLNIGEIFCAFLYRHAYLAAEHRRDFLCLLIQTDLPRRWTSARFRLPHCTDRFISPLNIGEIFCASLYRQNYLAAEHRRDFLCLIIQTELPRRWTSARFSVP